MLLFLPVFCIAVSCEWLFSGFVRLVQQLASVITIFSVSAFVCLNDFFFVKTIFSTNCLLIFISCFLNFIRNIWKVVNLFAISCKSARLHVLRFQSPSIRFPIDTMRFLTDALLI